MILPPPLPKKFFSRQKQPEALSASPALSALKAYLTPERSSEARTDRLTGIHISIHCTIKSDIFRPN